MSTTQALRCEQVGRTSSSEGLRCSGQDGTGPLTHRGRTRSHGLQRRTHPITDFVQTQVRRLRTEPSRWWSVGRVYVFVCL